MSNKADGASSPLTSSLLYTKGSDEVKEKVEKELEIADPPAEISKLSIAKATVEEGDEDCDWCSEN